MKHKYILLIILSIVIALLIFTACSEQNNSDIYISNPTPESNDNSHNDKSIVIQHIEDEELKTAVRTAINNELWYNGTYSDFNGFENQTSDIEIYKSSKLPDEICVFFNRPFERMDSHSFKKESLYYVIILSKLKHGFSSELTGYWMRNTEDEVKEELSTLDCELVQNSNVTFDSVTQPIFSPLSDSGINNLNKLRSKLPEMLKENTDFHDGVYNAYIRKFSYIEAKTCIVIEDKEKNQWIMTVYFSDDGNISIDKIYNADFDIRMYIVEQIKKVSYDVEILNIDK